MIVREARALLDQGVKELNLVAQDLTEWGCDLDGKQDLRTLLDGLLPLPASNACASCIFTPPE